ncbi:WD40 repeat domain-containing serine/threonine protein kinase [Rhizohabitans arisaemae]|uniref:WD40 repeat domain-containing serine/threonine protein kinase n=1 Tax=Rhizohabitans arisaemae TaxID=2720610 RepID=UPI0024B09E50|nr:serine/threonine-protein kinase [Rhizohabitans arisaemae]
MGYLGEGGQGVVYLAESASGERVAIKMLHTRLTRDEQARQRFLREISAASRVAQFSTARILEANVVGDRPYIVSEYVDGRSLDELVRIEGPRSPGALERLAVATAAALAAIHQAGIVHRDFKPSNVLIGPDGPVVIDFGIARALDVTATVSSGVLGTPSYMSPEQVSGERAGPPSDVFSWAATIVFAATGRPPFGQDTIPAVMHRVLYGDPDLTGMPRLVELVLRCLAKNPADRPTAPEIMLALVGHNGPSARTWPSPAPPPPPPPPPPRTPEPIGVDVPGEATRVRTFDAVYQTPGITPGTPLGVPGTIESPGGRKSAGASPLALIATVLAVAVAVAATVILVPRWFDGSTSSKTTSPSPESGGPTTSGTTPPAARPFGAKIDQITAASIDDVNVVTIAQVGGAPVIIAGCGYEKDFTIRTWDLRTRLAIGVPFAKQKDDVRAVAVASVNQTPILVSSGLDKPIHLTDLITHKRIGGPLSGHTDAVKALAVTELDGRPVAVSGSSDNTIRIWDLTTRQAVGEPLEGHTDDVDAVAIGRLDGRTIIVSAGDDDVIRIWDLATGSPVGDPLNGHTDDISTLAVTELDGRPVVVSAGVDDSVRLWDLTTRTPIGEPLEGHTDDIRSLAVGRAGGRPIAVSASDDNTLRVWDLSNRQPIGEPLKGHTDGVFSVTIGDLDGNPIAVSGSLDDSVRIWSLGSP